MAEAPRPEDPAYLARLLDDSPLMPDPNLRQHWQRLLPWLTTAERYELAAILLAVEHALA